MAKQLIIKVDNQFIHLCPELSISIINSNFPYQFCKFRTHQDIYWKVELISFDSQKKCLILNVIEYQVKIVDDFFLQIPKKVVTQIEFESFDWTQLEPLLSSYQKIHFLNLLKNQEASSIYENHSTEKTWSNFPGKNASINFNSKENQIDEFLTNLDAIEYLKVNSREAVKLEKTQSIKREPVKRVHEIEFKVDFNDSLFINGYVTFKKKIKGISQIAVFKINNDFIIPEYDNIKSWIAIQLKTKKFLVKAKIITFDGILSEIESTSPDISKIDSSLIEEIKLNRTISISKIQNLKGTKKALFNNDEMFQNLEIDDKPSNVFKEDEKSIFNALIKHYNTRNRKQLEYLGSYNQIQNRKLQFTLHPNFGFVFFIEGKEQYHFIWELLNSHATYIWSADKTQNLIDQSIKSVEDTIFRISEIGRQQYRKEYAENHFDMVLKFNLIDHNKISNNLEDSFKNWKTKLNDIINI
jgi:hypothetical protein